MTGCHQTRTIKHSPTNQYLGSLTCPQMSFRISTPIIDASTFPRENLLLHVTRGNFDISKYNQPIPSRSVPVTLRTLARVGERASAYLTTGDGSAI